MGAVKWRNKPLEDEPDCFRKLDLRWYKNAKRCKNPDCRKDSFVRTNKGICMACVIREQKGGAK